MKKVEVPVLPQFLFKEKRNRITNGRGRDLADFKKILDSFSIFVDVLETNVQFSKLKCRGKIIADGVTTYYLTLTQYQWCKNIILLLFPLEFNS